MTILDDIIEFLFSGGTAKAELHLKKNGFYTVDHMTLEEAMRIKHITIGYKNQIQSSLAIKNQNNPLHYDIIHWPGLEQSEKGIIVKGSLISTIILERPNDYEAGRLNLVKSLQKFARNSNANDKLTHITETYRNETPVFLALRKKYS